MKTRNILAAALILFSVSVFADGEKTSTCLNVNSKIDSSEFENPEMEANTLLNAASGSMDWMIDEVEEELEVADLSVSYAMRPLWNVEARDFELEVVDYKATEDLVPYWIIIEKEAELEVTDLAIN